MINLHLAPQEKLVTHPQFAAYLAGEKIYPINAELSIVGFCNAHCPWCFYADGELGSHRKDVLDFSVLVRVLEECAEMGVKSISWTGGGEPSLYPKIKEVVDFTTSLELQQGIFSNALAIPKYDPSKMEWIRITMTDKPFNIEAIKALRACKTLGFAFNYSGQDDNDYLGRTLDIAEKVGADYVQLRPALKFHGETVDIPVRLYAWQEGHPLLTITEYKFRDAKEKHGYTECEGYHFVPFVWEDGNVDVCSYMRKHEGYTLGNVYKESLRSILDRAPKSVPVHSQCQVCCRNHEINKSVHSSRQLQDRNFP